MYAMTLFVLFGIAATIPCILILQLLMVVYRKITKVDIGPREIYFSGIGTLILITIIAGYGMKDGRPEPVFIEGFVHYFWPVVVAILLRLLGWAFSRIRVLEGR